MPWLLEDGRPTEERKVPEPKRKIGISRGARGGAARLSCNQKGCMAVNRKELREKAKSESKSRIKSRKSITSKRRLKTLHKTISFFT